MTKFIELNTIGVLKNSQPKSAKVLKLRPVVCSLCHNFLLHFAPSLVEMEPQPGRILKPIGPITRVRVKRLQTEVEIFLDLQETRS
ncbi:hypothetical protein VNO77_03051 [Canavalia gladiata]|uniref:Uncharacterized protein n=1 Tax=Canavalia gladiata TaxID=3824 RepID=A0AAN9MZ88_CANGL